MASVASSFKNNATSMRRSEEFKKNAIIIGFILFGFIVLIALVLWIIFWLQKWLKLIYFFIYTVY